MADKFSEKMIAVRAKLMTASAKTLTDLLEQFGETPKAKDRLDLALEVDKLFMSEMGDQAAATSLLAFKNALEEELKASGKGIKKETGDDGSTKSGSNVQSVSTSTVKFHKDFKISGQIDCKSGISYISLIRQMELGLKKGHSEADVIDGIIRAVIPTSSLRSYLDGRQDLSLPVLRGILRGHYAEKNSTELYSELASAVQDAKETSSEFLMRSMDLRNKILFASQESSDELKYSPDLVHKLFARTVQTGLRDIVIRQEMKQFLSEDKSDAELLDELNKIVRRENENKQKVGKGYVSMVTRSSTNCQDELLAEVRALKAEIQQLKLSRDNNNNDQRPVTRGCPDCRSNTYVIADTVGSVGKVTMSVEIAPIATEDQDQVRKTAKGLVRGTRRRPRLQSRPVSELS